MKKAFCVLLSLVLLSGCGSAAAAPEEEAWYSFTDDSGSAVSLSEAPETVAVLFSSYADIWATAGGTVDVTVGESVERGFASESAILVDAGSGHTSIDLETIVTEDPDYIFITTMGDEEAARAYVLDLFTQSGWKELSAVAEGNYVFLPRELFHFKPNARWAEAGWPLKGRRESFMAPVCRRLFLACLPRSTRVRRGKGQCCFGM